MLAATVVTMPRLATSPSMTLWFWSVSVPGHRGDLPVAEGRDAGNAEGPEEDHGRPGPRQQGRRPEEGPGQDQRDNREQPQPAATGAGDGERGLCQGKALQGLASYPPCPKHSALS